MSPARMAVVDPQHGVLLIGPQGEDPAALTAPSPRAGAWGMLTKNQEFWSWPTWSPDGRWVAALCAQSSDRAAGPVRVVSLNVDGVRQEEWAQIHDGMPLYLHWHPGGEHLAVIAQQGEELQLSVLSRSRMGAARAVENGVPIFFGWEPEGQRVLVHVGARAKRSKGAGRLLWRDPLGEGEDLPLLQVPGNFCAPVFVGRQAVIALHDDAGSSLHRLEGDQPGPSLDLRAGLVAMLPSPDGRWLAVTSSPDGEGQPYQGLDLLDMSEEEPRPLPLAAGPLLAFFWSPDSRFLVYVVVDREQNCLQWYRLGLDGSLRSLGTFWPTRDMLFYLHFFDQYALSHPLISPDGRWLCYAGYPAGGGHADLSVPSRIYVQDLERPERAAEEVCGGSCAVFAPGAGAGQDSTVS